MLGSSMTKKMTTYSVIEFDDRVLTNIEIDPALDNYLRRCINAGSVRLWIHGIKIFAVEVDGKVYAERYAPIASMLIALLVAICLCFIFVGIPIVINMLFTTIPGELAWRDEIRKIPFNTLVMVCG
jgi:hypothetical protein